MTCAALPLTFAVELCGRLADSAGPVVAVTLPAGEVPTLEALRAALSAAHPALAPVLADPRIRGAIDEVFAPDGAPVRQGQVIAFLPPVSGG